MTGFFEIFNPGQRHSREQKDFDKVAVVPTHHGGRGPLQVDLDAGTVVLPARPPAPQQDGEADPQSAGSAGEGDDQA